MPREPPYFDAPYHSTDLNLEIGTGVTVVPAPITNPHRKSDGNEHLIYFFLRIHLFVITTYFPFY